MYKFTRALVLTALALLPAATASALSPPIFILSWGSNGTANGQFQFVQGLSRNNADDIWSADFQGNRVQKFTKNGVWLQTITAVTGTQTLLQPTSTGVGPGDELYVGDSGHNQIVKYSSTGAFVTRWSHGFNQVTGVAVSQLTGRVFATDYMNHRVQVFSPSGTFLYAWGSMGTGPGQFQFPYGLAIDPTTQNVVVADLINNRVQVFDAAGNFLLQFGSAGSGNGQFQNPASPAVDLSGNIYVSDESNHRVQVFDMAGNYLTQWGTFGSANGEFNFPNGIVANFYGQVYVADRNNNRIQEFSDPATPTQQSTWGRVKALYR